MTISSIVASDIIPLKKRGLIQGLVNIFLYWRKPRLIHDTTGIVNIFYGIGAGLGAPLGGVVVARFDWRWAFLAQVPFLVTSWILILIFVKYKLPGQSSTTKAAFKQIDWLGSATLIVCISSLLLGLSFKNNQVDSASAGLFSSAKTVVQGLPWSSYKVWVSLTSFVVFLFGFVAVEAYVSPTPVARQSVSV